MFRKITVRNFKSLVDTTVDLAPFTVLVGKNGSGKSSFLQAIGLAAWAVQYESLDDVLERAGVGFLDLVSVQSGKRQTIVLEAELNFPTPGAPGPSDGAKVRMTFAQKEGRVMLADELVGPADAAGGISQGSYRIGREGQALVARENEGFISHANVLLGHSMLRDVLLTENAGEVFPVLSRVGAQFLDYVHFQVWNADLLRKEARTTRKRYLARTLGRGGEGLADLLDRIRVSRPANWKKLKADLHEFYPKLRDLGFEAGSDPDHSALVFKEQAANGRSSRLYRPSQMSDGFLRLLGLLSIKHQALPLTTFGYEEPENGLHPDALDDCMRHLKDIVRNGTQVIVTTHSPYLLNYLLEDRDEPRPELRLVLRDEDGRTRILPPAPDKVERARRHGFGVGELWGMLLDEKELAAP